MSLQLLQRPWCSVSHRVFGPYVSQQSYDFPLASCFHPSFATDKQATRPDLLCVLTHPHFLRLHYISVLSQRSENKGPELSCLRREFPPNNNEMLFLCWLQWSPSMWPAFMLVNVSSHFFLYWLCIWYPAKPISVKQMISCFTVNSVYFLIRKVKIVWRCRSTWVTYLITMFIDRQIERYWKSQE